ncbi:MAG: hypothetical protein K8U57_21290 [Planctomycetes bacterium]|nr:hypothetical protein [Planctomycetota bacterium]
MSYDFIAANASAWPVSWLCDTLGVSTAGYYAWCDRDASTRQQRHDALLVEIQTVHTEVKAR